MEVFFRIGWSFGHIIALLWSSRLSLLESRCQIMLARFYLWQLPAQPFLYVSPQSKSMIIVSLICSLLLSSKTVLSYRLSLISYSFMKEHQCRLWLAIPNFPVSCLQAAVAVPPRAVPPSSLSSSSYSAPDSLTSLSPLSALGSSSFSCLQRHSSQRALSGVFRCLFAKALSPLT